MSTSPTMSFKGITWAGNVYQKFEAMCLEVEEAMYQDTVKYVENQVQKVGVSVKKFCSEVMDDMHPLSCIDPTSVASDDMSLITYGYADVKKNATPGILGDRRDLMKKENQDQVLSTITAEKGSLPCRGDLGLFLLQSPGIFIENEAPEKCKKIGVQRRAIGIKRISRSDNPSKDSCRNTSASEDNRSKLVNCEMRTSCRVASDNMDVTSSSDFGGRCVPREAVRGNARHLNDLIKSSASDKILSSESASQEDSSRVACDDSPSNIAMQEPSEAVKGNTALQENQIKSPASKKVSSTESKWQIEDVSDCVPPAPNNNLSDESMRLKGDSGSTTSCSDSPAESTGASVNDIAACSSSRIKACDLEYEEKGFTVSNEVTSVTDCSSSASSPSCNAESSNKDFITTNKESFDIEFVENDEVSELRLEKFETDDCRDDLEESCILVEGEELQFDLQGTRKHKSYKKRIREELSSKLRSRKDEQLVFSQDKQETWDRARVRVRAVDSDEQKLSACDSVESDWELL